MILEKCAEDRKSTNNEVTYFTKVENLSEATIISLFYDFRLALELEDFEFCEKIKTELEIREKKNDIDKEFITALLSFYNKYSDGETMNKEYFNDFFSKYI